jgi:chemotaxis protein methyltransferase CheR
MATATLTPDAVSYVCDLVRNRSAIELDASKTYLVEARLAALARDRGYPTTIDLIQNARTKRVPDVERRIVEALTTNETSFFRDMHPFEALRTTIVPELITRNASRRSLNIWSAACSTGQELYSVAMSLRTHFPDLLNWNVRLLGTDISEEVLERARNARFSQIEVNRGLPAALLMKFFQRQEMHWQLVPELRAMTVFQKLNFIDTWPQLPQMDVVFLRNVLIYFSPETKKAILSKIRSVMAPHAVLFLGAAETTMGLDDAFVRVQAANSIFYRIKT